MLDMLAGMPVPVSLTSIPGVLRGVRNRQKTRTFTAWPRAFRIRSSSTPPQHQRGRKSALGQVELQGSCRDPAGRTVSMLHALATSQCCGSSASGCRPRMLFVMPMAFACRRKRNRRLLRAASPAGVRAPGLGDRGSVIAELCGDHRGPRAERASVKILVLQLANSQRRAAGSSRAHMDFTAGRVTRLNVLVLRTRRRTGGELLIVAKAVLHDRTPEGVCSPVSGRHQRTQAQVTERSERCQRQ